MRKVVIYTIYEPVDALYALEKDYPEAQFHISSDKEEVKHLLHDAEIFITGHCSIDMIQVAPALKWIQSYFAGVDAYPMEEIKKRGILVTSGQGIAAGHMAEYIICSMIMLARNFPAYARRQSAKIWDRTLEQGEIDGATIGILGLGVIGKVLARKASLMGMKVIGVKRKAEEMEYVDELYLPEDMGEVLKKSDFVVNLLPHTSETDEIVNKDFIDLMKPSASFINVSRGRTVNESDMVEALRDKRIRGMVSDVFFNEPLALSSPLWELENVFITPHMAGLSVKYYEKASSIFRNNLSAYLRGEGKFQNLVKY